MWAHPREKKKNKRKASLSAVTFLFFLLSFLSFLFNVRRWVMAASCAQAWATGKFPRSFYLTSIPFQFYSSPAVLSLSLSLSCYLWYRERTRKLLFKTQCGRGWWKRVRAWCPCVRRLEMCVCVGSCKSVDPRARPNFLLRHNNNFTYRSTVGNALLGQTGKRTRGVPFFFLLFDCKQQQKYL